MDWSNPQHPTPPLYTPNSDDASSMPAFTSHGESKYHFRLAPRESLISVTTWVDQDESGDYDPSGKQVSHVPGPRKRIERIEREKDDVEITKKPKHNSWQHGRHEGKSCYVALKLHSKRGKERLKELSELYPDSRHNPHSSDADISDQSMDFWSQSQSSLGTDGTLQHQESYHLRKNYDSLFAAPTRKFKGYRSPGDATLGLGHPAARGCKACLELHIQCSLLQEGAAYPCAVCVDDMIDCELILQPLQKRPCESCRHRRIACSYRHAETNHKLPCQQCAESLRNCCAGPASGRVRIGPSLDQKVHEGRLVDSQRMKSSTKAAAIERPFVTCTQCRRDKKWCTLSGKSQEIPCGRCRVAKRDCTFEAISKRTNAVARSQRRKRTHPEPATTGVGVTRVITTSLAHPIIFNHIPPEDGSAPCHWCEDLAYGIVGLGEVRVEVIDFGGHQGYTEIEGGHVSKGKDPSRMCMDCTMERFLIASCKPHEMQRLEDMETEGFDYDAAFEYLLPGMAATAPFKWCSVCPRVAFLACHKPQMAIADDEEDLAMTSGTGCGLHLCEECAVALMTEHDGFLEGHIEMLQRSDADFIVRADVDFLHQDGELLTRAPYLA